MLPHCRKSPFTVGVSGTPAGGEGGSVEITAVEVKRENPELGMQGFEPIRTEDTRRHRLCLFSRCYEATHALIQFLD